MRKKFTIVNVNEEWLGLLNMSWNISTSCPVCGKGWNVGTESLLEYWKNIEGCPLSVTEGKVDLGEMSWIVNPLPCMHGFNLCKYGKGNSTMTKNSGGFLLKKCYL